MEAIEKTSDPYHTRLWVGKKYADLGFFADAVEVLLDLCSRFKEPSPRRLLAEVRWWRDNAHRLPWLPPAGDGSRYKKMMQSIDPTAPTEEEYIHEIRARRAQLKKLPDWKPVIDPELAKLFGDALSSEKPAPAKTIVDWSFLDRDDGKPGELPNWVKKEMKWMPEHADDIAKMHRWTRPVLPPSAPPRRDPNEPPFDPSEILNADIDLDDLDDDDDDDEFDFEKES